MDWYFKQMSPKTPDTDKSEQQSYLINPENIAFTMRLSSRFKKNIAVFLLVNLVSQLVIPTASYALTSGYAQPEFTSFESPGSSDMVNLLTGNMTYSLPLLDVPGPEGGFSIPLSYHAGIGLEQQASWVGLGWNINPGSIARSLNQYPDDANGEEFLSKINYEGNRGWRTGGLGIVPMGWDSERGHYGSVSLLGLAKVSWENGLKGGDIMGATLENGKVGFDARRFAEATISAGSLLLTAGSGGAAITGKSLATAAAKQAAWGVGTAAVLGGAISLAQGNRSYAGFNQPTYIEQDKIIYKNYWNFLKKDAAEKAYGSLYIHNLPSQTQSVLSVQAGSTSSLPNKVRSEFSRPGGVNRVDEAVADIFTNIDDSKYYAQSTEAIHISNDYFSVMGGGSSGVIKPYRLETVTAPMKRMAESHENYIIQPHLAYKVGFRYDGALSNYYDHHKGNAPAGAYKLGVSSDWTQLSVQLDDNTLYGQRTQDETNRKGLADRRVSQGKHVEWYSNAEIAAAAPYSPLDQGKFLEFQTPQAGTYGSQPTRNIFRASLPPSGIGGFVITSEDGTVYHYSLPVYNFKTHSRNFDKDDPGGKFAWQKNQQPYATTWLLTAITQSDYLDRAPLGTVGEEDWGGWVKFEYGKFAPQYKWRTPYAGYQYGANEPVLTSPKSASFTEGYKETYYLNRIATRSHTALFIKDIRQDGRGHYTRSTQPNPDLGNLNEQFPSSSLRLDEIVLLTDEDYRRLTTADGLGTGSPALTNNTNNNAITQDASLLRNGDTFREVLDVRDIGADARIRTFLNEKALKRIAFGYTYELCPGTINSFADATNPPALTDNDNSGAFASNYQNRNGKLTLRKVSFYGRNNVKLVPDYVFDYGLNPAYDTNKWDEYGMYNSRGTLAVNSHQAAQGFGDDATAWSLKKILNPLGNSIEFSYERDQYSRIAGLGLQRVEAQDANNDGVLEGSNMQDYVTPGDVVAATYHIRDRYVLANQADCPPNTVCDEIESELVTISQRVAAVNATSITFETPAAISPLRGPYVTNGNGSDYYYGGRLPTTVSLELPKNTLGGDLRVSELRVTDGSGTTFRTRYLYNESVFSSGTISKMPDYYANAPYAFTYNVNYALKDLIDLPETSVMYGKVTVLEGKLTSNEDYTKKSEFEFTTPHFSMVKKQAVPDYSEKNSVLPNANNFPEPTKLRLINQKIEVRTSQIGQPKSIRQYNSRGMLTEQTVFEYAEQVPNAQWGPQGLYTEGVLTAERIAERIHRLIPIERPQYRFNRTTKVYYPSVLVARQMTAGTIRNREEFQRFDFFTGQTLQSKYTDALGKTYQSLTVPAYEVYPGMGPKGTAADNKNMLSQTAAGYLYKVENNNQKIMGVSLNTWSNTWNTHRVFNTNTQRYENAPLPSPMWRTQASWVWDGRALNPDGSLKDFVPFDWQPNATQQHANWLKTSEVIHYDLGSMPLSSRDMNSNHASQKLDATGKYVLASCSGARYTEMAYSGAEDKVQVGTAQHFGGEVLGGEKQDATYAHTGLYSVKVPAGEEGFVYRAMIGPDQPASQTNTEVGSGRTYRLSVWIHKSDADAKGARLYARIGGTTVAEAGLASAGTERSGDWYLVNLLVDVPVSANNQLLTVGCRNAGSQVAWMDDFRFHPVDAPLSAYVYNRRGELTHKLDNDNLYTRYQYDDTGKLWKTYQERLGVTGNEQLIQEKRIHFARYK